MRMGNVRIVQNKFYISLVDRRPVDRLREYEEKESDDPAIVRV